MTEKLFQRDKACGSKVNVSLQKIWINHWIDMDYFYNVYAPISSLKWSGLSKDINDRISLRGLCNNKH